jgi:predicted nucleotidyltransferase
VAGAALDPVLAIAREWAGKRCEALILSGSHASGEGVWCRWREHPVTLSDVDLYAIVPDEAEARAARARIRAGRHGLAPRLLALGFAAPLELAVLTHSGLARQPARPGTLELARRGRVVAGDPTAIASLPRFTPRDVPFEETLLLLENRGFELLLAHAGLGADDELAALRARHALLKAATDLATVLTLARGELPEGAAARIEWARAHALPALAETLPGEALAALTALPALWDTALRWRAGVVERLPSAQARAEWSATVRAWAAVWWSLQPGAPREPWARALRVAARAPLRRRARQALASLARPGVPATTALRSAMGGTAQHRVHGSATVLLLAAAGSAGVPALPVGALRALRALAVTRAADWETARREVVAAWDRGWQDGQRTAEGM